MKISELIDKWDGCPWTELKVILLALAEDKDVRPDLSLSPDDKDKDE